jgi:hypothetical protein
LEKKAASALQKALANAKRDQKLAVDKAVVEAKYEAK